MNNIYIDQHKVKEFLRDLDFTHDPALGSYVLESHLNRLSQTYINIPNSNGGAIIEIGAITPTLAFCEKFLDYKTIEGTIPLWEEGMCKHICDIYGRIYKYVFHVFNVGLSVDFPLPDAVFDTVICNEMIEHLVFDPSRGLIDQVNRILKKGGVLVLTTPNITSLDSIIRMTRNDTPLIHPIFSKNGWIEHAKEYSPFELKSMIERNGFEVIKLTTIVEPYLTDESSHAGLKGILKEAGYNFDLSKLFTLIQARKV